MLRFEVAVVKTNKYASSQSGDTVEIVERAKGGMSIIIADGQGSGRAAKLTSNLVVSKAMNLLAEGARDGAVARATHDFLYTVKNGKVSATLTIISLDMETKSIIISRNGHLPVFILKNNEETILADKTQPIGVHRFMKPTINEIPIAANTTIVAFTDGFIEAGERHGKKLEQDQEQLWQLMKQDVSTEEKAKELFDLAFELDQKRPGDDISVIVTSIFLEEEQFPVRTLNLSIPI